jgi:hypothetical protein
MGERPQRLSPARSLIAAGGLLSVAVAITIGLGSIAVLTVGLSGAASAFLGWRMNRLRPGALQSGYAWACCVFGATTAGQGYFALRLGVDGSARVQAWLWVIAGVMVVAGATATLLIRPRSVAR